MTRVPASTRLLLRGALVLYTITIVIGILNGTDLVDFDRNALLTHLHAGTLGWITLAVLGTMLWVFNPESADEPAGRSLAVWSIAAIAFYIVGFWTGDQILRPLAGSAALIPLVGGIVWAGRRSEGAGSDAPRMGLLLALVSVTIGGVLGILLGLQRTNVINWVSPGVADAHPQMLFAGYLFLAGSVVAEWLLVGEEGSERHSRSGQVQVWLMFLAGLAMGAGLAFDAPALALLPLPAGVVAVVLILTRMRHRIRQSAWSQPSESRLASTGIIWLVVSFALLGYLFARYPEGPFPPRQGLAFDHAIFIGGMTNVLLGVVRQASRRMTRQSVDQIIYYGLNGGLILFFLGLMLDSDPLIRAGTPIVGLALLTAIAAYITALQSGGSTQTNHPGSIDKVFIKLMPLFTRLHVWILRRFRGRFAGRTPAGGPILLLTTTGRRTGKRRSVALGYLDGGDNLYVVASNGGQPTEPAWSLNLKSNPDAEVQFGSQQVVTEVKLLHGQDREEAWQRYVAAYPAYEKAQTWTDREFPVFRIPVNVTFAPAAPTREDTGSP